MDPKSRQKIGERPTRARARALMNPTVSCSTQVQKLIKNGSKMDPKMIFPKVLKKRYKNPGKMDRGQYRDPKLGPQNGPEMDQKWTKKWTKE